MQGCMAADAPGPFRCCCLSGLSSLPFLFMQEVPVTCMPIPKSMKVLFQYLRPYRTMVGFVLLLASINMGFSMMDPIIFGKLITLAGQHQKANTPPGVFNWHDFLFVKTTVLSGKKKLEVYGVVWLLLASISVAMVSRIAKNFQDYFLSVIIQKFGAKVFTDGLKQAMKLPYQEFEDQRSGETLSVLQKVRADTEKFMSNFVNILFSVFIGIVIVAIFAATISPLLPIVYFGGTAILMFISNVLSKKAKTIQKTIVAQTTSLAGTTTESLRNIELVKSLGLTDQEVERLNNNTYKILGLEITKVKRVRSIAFVQGTFVHTLRQVILFMLMWFIFKGEMDFGQLVTMQIYSFFIFGPLQDIANIILSYREAEASLNNFQVLMQKQSEAQPLHPRHLGPVRDLQFEQVSFKHQTASHKAIDNISFQATTGETIAFVGPSGSGKTTLMKLLVGLYRPQE